MASHQHRVCLMAGDRVARSVGKFIYIRVGGQIRWIYPPLNKPKTLCTIVSDDMETINFEKKIRPEQKNTKGRVIQNERTYLDFLISGQSAKSILKADNFDLISPFGWGDEKFENEIIKEFIGLKRPEIPSGRLMIYVCPECGDIGCGSITADIEITDDKVIWKNFGYENNDPDIDFEPYKGIGLIEFRKTDYLEKFQNIKRS